LTHTSMTTAAVRGVRMRKRQHAPPK
jgi:hypothetical protein